MTEYEVRDLATSMFESATSVTGLYLSVVSGYLIVAWLVGRPLTKPQVILINFFFAVFSSLLAIRWVVLFHSGLKYHAMVLEINPKAFFVSTFLGFRNIVSNTSGHLFGDCNWHPEVYVGCQTSQD